MADSKRPKSLKRRGSSLYIHGQVLEKLRRHLDKAGNPVKEHLWIDMVLRNALTQVQGSGQLWPFPTEVASEMLMERGY